MVHHVLTNSSTHFGFSKGLWFWLLSSLFLRITTEIVFNNQGQILLLLICCGFTPDLSSHTFSAVFNYQLFLVLPDDFISFTWNYRGTPIIYITYLNYDYMRRINQCGIE